MKTDIRDAVSSSKMRDIDWKYPLVAPNREGTLLVDDNPKHTLSWSEYGNPHGEPVMFLHGGPGGGCAPLLSRFFDPKRYRVILFDQRGCGQSRPSVATDGAEVALTNNTTQHLIGDILKLRSSLHIEGAMHVFGGSWGSTLALAYAIAHPKTVATLILRGIFIGDRQDFLYMYQGNAATYAAKPYAMTAPGSYITFPEAWKTFVEIIEPSERGDMMGAYKRIFDLRPSTDEERQRQTRAALAWSVWEGVISNLVPDPGDVGKFQNHDFAVCFAQIEAHYFANNLFLKSGHLVDNIPHIAQIPIHIVHGRYDQVCPLTQGDILVAALAKAGATPASYIKTIAGHSMLEKETALALIAIMDTLPRLN